MAGEIHAAAPHHLPPFITPPGEVDTLFVIIVVGVVAVVLMIGNFYFRLHALPERMAHGASSAQLQMVGILALLALFTHNNLFWIAALLLAALKMPDFATPLNAIADGVAGLVARDDAREAEQAAVPAAPAAEAHVAEAGPATDPEADPETDSPAPAPRRADEPE